MERSLMGRSSSGSIPLSRNRDQQSSGMMIERVGINETGMMGEMGDEEEEPGMDQ